MPSIDYLATSASTHSITHVLFLQEEYQDCESLSTPRSKKSVPTMPCYASISDFATRERGRSVRRGD
jgi:hypothetical protein